MLIYDPGTGEFYWLVSLRRTRAGDRAGSLKPSGYRELMLDGVQYKEHRLAWFYMTGAWPAETIDHKNCVRSDNKWGNLREATKAQQVGNRPLSKVSATGFKGVSRSKGGKYHSCISQSHRTIHLGTFDTAEAAHEAYCLKARELHGEFARAA